MSKPITQRQFDFLHELREKKDMSGLPESQQSFLSRPENIQRLSKEQASLAIQSLIDCPWKSSRPAPAPQTQVTPTPEEDGKASKASHYFVVDPTDGVEKFITVWMSVRASDDMYPISNSEHRNKLLQTIAEDPVTAMNEYGQRLGICGRCGRTLTRKDSRLRGLGPICAGIVRAAYGMDLNLDNVSNLLDSESD